MATGSTERCGGEASGDESLQILIDAFYGDMRRMARRERFRVGAGATLCTTALIHEAWIKLQNNRGVWRNRSHFLGTAALAMRQVLVSDAKARHAAKRNFGAAAEALDDHDEAVDAAADTELIHIDRALQHLSRLSPRLTRVVECRYFAGYSDAEIADALGVSERTVHRDWIKARAWLYRELVDDGADVTLAEDDA